MRHNLCACEVFIFRFAASMILSALIDHQTYTAEKILYFQKHPFSKDPLLRYIYFSKIFILTKYSLLQNIHIYKLSTFQNLSRISCFCNREFRSSRVKTFLTRKVICQGITLSIWLISYKLYDMTTDQLAEDKMIHHTSKY